MSDTPASVAAVSEAPFDISTFNVKLPNPLDFSCRVDMNGVRFYGREAWKQAAGGYTFGVDTPTWALIGLVNPTFTPMLLVYGTVTLNTNNNGINFYNYVGWHWVSTRLPIRITCSALRRSSCTAALYTDLLTSSIRNDGITRSIVLNIAWFTSTGAGR
jgi:hypothetical protein